jgi:glycosyltransferase involved in cell wall biosynthesis
VRFLFASSIIPTKGVDRLIRAFGRLHTDSTLTIAGHSPPFDGHPRFAATLEQTARSIPGIEWLGAVEPKAVTALIAAHDVLVLPSIWPENSPLIVREASAQGLQIIGPKIGGTRELAPEADCVGDERELFEALKNAANRGRTRLRSKPWPSPAEHAAHLISQVY